MPSTSKDDTMKRFEIWQEDRSVLIQRCNQLEQYVKEEVVPVMKEQQSRLVRALTVSNTRATEPNLPLEALLYCSIVEACMCLLVSLSQSLTLTQY